MQDQKEVAQLLLKARGDLLMIKRVGAIGQFYGDQRLVIEKEEVPSTPSIEVVEVNVVDDRN